MTTNELTTISTIIATWFSGNLSFQKFQIWEKIYHLKTKNPMILPFLLPFSFLFSQSLSIYIYFETPYVFVSPCKEPCITHRETHFTDGFSLRGIEGEAGELLKMLSGKDQMVLTVLLGDFRRFLGEDFER